jgi:hypothetical protein
MRHRGRFSARERKVRSALTKLVHERRLLRGSLVTMSRTCGTAGCKCNRGQKHVSLYLSIRVDGKRKMSYVPSAWEETVRSWVRTSQEMDGLMDEISAGCLERFLQETDRGE